jgi:pimeloyl-ACP methyl ester carboxylesterase
MSKTIYCISGLGADERIFSKINLNGYELRHIPWLRPEKKENIESYAKRMAESFREKNPVLLGVSFGGMIGIEIARQIPLEKLFLVSSIKSSAELPNWMKVVGKMQLNKFLPVRSFKFTERVDNDRLGVSNEEEREMVRAYRRSADFVYINWAVNQVLNWRNDWLPDNLIHIHGDKDRMFPIKKISATHVIPNGTHLMIYNRAKEIAECIHQEL